MAPQAVGTGILRTRCGCDSSIWDGFVTEHGDSHQRILQDLAALIGQAAEPGRAATDSLAAQAGHESVGEKGRWLAAMVANSPDLIGLASLEGEVLFLSLAAREILGLEATTGGNAFEAIPEAELRRLRETIIPAVHQAGQWNGQFQLRHFASGELVPFEMNAFLSRDPATGRARALATLGREIVEAHRRRQRMRESEEFYRTLIETLPVTVVLADPQGIVTYISPAAKEMFGLEAGEGLGTRPTDWIAPEHHDVVFERMRRVMIEGRPQPPVEYQMFHRNGSSVWASLTSAPVLDSESRIKGVITVCQNIHDRKLAEEQLKALNETLERRVAERTAVAEQRTAQLQAMAVELTEAEHRERRRLAQILHDHLQQLLVAVRIKVDRLGRRIQDEAAHEAIGPIHEMLDQCIAESRSLTVELSPPVLYDAGLAAGLEWLARWMEQKHHLSVHVRVDPRAEPAEEATRVHLFQAVRELLFNVVKYAGTSRAKVTMTRAEGPMTRIEVRDRGVGFDPSRQEDHALTRGGFGLFSIRERLELLGGSLAVQSAPGRGTQIVLLAPLHAPSAAAVPALVAPPRAAGIPPTAAPPAAGGKIRLLLADDHPLLRKGLADLFRERPEIELVGEAGDGQEAVAFARETRPDVVLMDVTMPRLNGIEATRQITAEMPGVRVIGLSMHEGEDMARAMREAGACDYHSKSEDADILIAAVLGPAALRGTSAS